MLRPRVIPVLLLSESGVVKTECFRSPRYVGDPINALRIFNEKEVDEIVILDIEATLGGRGPDFARVRELAGECFMPMAYGGGVRGLRDAEKLFAAGAEKVVVGTAAIEQPDVVREMAKSAGSQSVVVCIDVRRGWLGRSSVFVRGGRCNTGLDPLETARRMEDAGAGEIILQVIDCDGRRQGYDLDLITKVSAVVRVPVVACGGAGNLQHFGAALHAGASAAAAGSFFVFYGKHQAVLITYPESNAIESLQSSRL